MREHQARRLSAINWTRRHNAPIMCRVTPEAARHLDAAHSNGDALGEFAGWPRLEACPECEYNLTGLRPGRRCPECGWGAGHLAVFLPAWSSRSAVDKGLRNVTALTLMCFGLLFACCVAGTPWMVLAILATMFVPVWLVRRLIPRSREYDTLLIPCVDGVLICRAREKPVYKQWGDLAGVTLHSKRRGFHDLFLRPRRTLPQPRLAERIVLEGSIEAAQKVANAISNRIERAAAERLPDESTDESSAA